MIKRLFTEEDRRRILFLILSGISLIISFFLRGMLPVDVAWVAILLCGIPIVKEAAVALGTEFDIKADLLVSLALIAAVIIGEIFAAGEVAFIMTIGAALEDHTVAKARAGIEKLVRLTPRTARLVADGQERIVPAQEVGVGDILRVLAGETVAVDGVILHGQTSIDQSVMTGESLPVDKGEGDEVSSGTVNQFGTFDMTATKVGEDSSLQRMIRLVESADAGKAKIVGIADRWATWIVVVALAAAAITWMVTGEIIRSVTILVVFCPCALVLATPTAIMAGIGNAARQGILIREGDALERLAKVTRIAFDKTGTLTHGRPALIAVESWNDQVSRDNLLAWTAAAELRSEHPLGKAVAAHFTDATGCRPQEPEGFVMLAGRGVCATVEGRRIMAGNPQLLQEQGIPLAADLAGRTDLYHQQGSTIVYIGIDGQFAGFIALSDTLRSPAADVVKQLDAIGAIPVLLTGDNSQAAASMAAAAGIERWHANCLPEDKLAAIAQYQEQGEPVCMIGDGVNDAPALKKAFVGVAMGGIGSDIAVDAADMVLVGDDIQVLPHLLRLAKKTMGTIRLNLALSMLLNFAAILLAITGVLSPVVGALVHNVGSVAVIINSALLLQWKR